MIKICIADDEEYVLKSIRRRIEQSGLDVVISGTAMNGVEAYELYEKVMNNLGKYVERVEGTVVHYNNQRGLGTISRYDEDGIFFRQADYVYDEDVQRRDKVEYTPIETFDNKKNEITNKAILIITTEEYLDFGY